MLLNILTESDDKMRLKADDEVILLGCSNGLSLEENVRSVITELYDCLVNEFNLKVHISPTIYIDPLTNDTHEASYRKEELFNSMLDSNIKAIIDLSGGDLANEVLAQFSEDDWQRVKTVENKFYIGYSDNSVILNALMIQTPLTAVNFLVTNIIKDKSGLAKDGFRRVLFNNERIDRSSTIPEALNESTTVMGGNIRCYLKLAGTPFFNLSHGQGLLLEAQSGDINKIRSYLAQLELLDAFEEVDFIVLGQFTEVRVKEQTEALHKIIQSYQNKYHFKLYYTDYVGHHKEVYPFVMN